MRIFRSALFLTCSFVFVAPAAAQDSGTVTLSEPSYPRPEAADKTLGMALMSASVQADGTLIRGSGVANVEYVDTGTYRVYFKRNIADCDHVASRANGAALQSYPGPTIISAAPSGPNQDRVWVIAYTPGTATRVDSYFSVIVFCPK